MTLVVPIAKEGYDRRDEQNFREWSRRNIDNATTMATAFGEAFRNLPEYADDTAAGAAGLVAGKFYRTATGVVMVKL